MHSNSKPGHLAGFFFFFFFFSLNQDLGWDLIGWFWGVVWFRHFGRRHGESLSGDVRVQGTCAIWSCSFL